jgi:PAS domain S-box-containing protein
VNTTSDPDDIHVLHVDDDPAFAELVETFLGRHEDVVVHSETDPEAAIDRVESVDCVVSDYDMPDVDGLELLRRVRERRPKLPFVLFTGKGNEEIASEAIAAGVSGYLQKGGGSERYELLVNRIRTVVSEARATERAREATERLEEVFERTTDGIVSVDDDWRYTYLNARAAEVLGIDPSEAVGTEVWSAFPGLVGSSIEAELRSAMETGEPTSFDAYYEPLETHFAIRAFPGDDGLSIYFSDVTDERHARRQLASERRLLDAALDALDDVFYVLDETGDRLVRWNDELEAVTGLAGGELSTVDVTDLFVPADRERVSRSVDRVLDGEELSGAARFDGPGGPHVFQFHTVPLYDESGVLVGACGIGRDVTDQREREAHLERVETIVEALGDPVYTADEEGRLTYVNDAFVDLTGYDAERALGSDAGSLLKTEAGVEAAHEAIRRAYRRDAPARFEFELQTADGDAVACEDHLSLLPTDGEFRGTAGVIRDVSRRREREATLRRQRDQLDEFAAVVSHDLGNPLSVALGHVQHAVATGETDRLDAAEAALERMDRMTDELLRLARTGAVVDDPEPVAVADVAREAWAVTDTRDATLVVEEALPTVPADASRLAALFENLFRNAVEHGLDPREGGHDPAGSDGRSPVAVDGDPDNDHGSAVLANGDGRDSDAGEGFEIRVGALTAPDGAGGFFVEDDGVGFDAETFDPEDLFDPGVSTATDGTGYGLTIVRDVAEAHGWTVDATTGHDGGARFEFRVGD